MMPMGGKAMRYIMTIISPTNVLPGLKFIENTITATIETAARPRSGPKRKSTLEEPSGIIVSFSNNFRKSAYGWNHGGPTRICMRAVTLRSIHVIKRPTTAVKRKPGNIIYEKIILSTFMPFS
jgi:hypothetical protein